MRGTKSIVVGALVIALAGVLSVGCKKTVKGEESRWTSANRTADELAVLYPGFKAAIEERRREAKTIYDAAQAVEDKDARIKQLASANTTLTRGFVGQLAEVDDKIKQIRAKLVQVSGAGDKAADQRMIGQAKTNTERSLRDVQSTLERGAPDAKSADILVAKVARDLDEVAQQLDMLLPKAEPTAPATAKPGTATTAPTEPTPANWTCEYCDHSNDPTAVKCANCGAAKAGTE